MENAEPVAEAAKPEPPTAKAPDISILGTWTIHEAAEKGNIEAVKQYLAASVDVNAKNSGLGKSPLLLAAYDRHKEIVELLIAKGADVNAKDGIGGKTTARMGKIKDQYLV